LGWPNDASSANGGGSLTTMMMRKKCLMKRRVTRACRLLFLLSWTLTLLDGFDIHDLRLFILTQLIPLPHFGQLAT
jgi:hypothetical protein